MKKLLFLMLLFSCTKEPGYLQTRIIGKIYKVKNNIFNKGTIQPKSPVRVDSLDRKDSTPYILYYYCTDANGIGGWPLPTSDLK